MHSQCLLSRYKVVCCLLPASASATFSFLRSHVTSTLFFHLFLPQLSLLWPNTGLGAFPQLHYMVQAVGRLSPRSNRSWSLQTLYSLPPRAVWSASPVSYTICMLWAVLLGVCCFAVFRRVHMPICWSVRLIYALLE